MNMRKSSLILLSSITFLLIGCGGTKQANNSNLNVGGRLLYTLFETANNTAIYTSNVDGTGLTRLSRQGGRNDLLKISPDHTKLVLNHAEILNDTSSYLPSLYIMNVDGSGERQLTTANLASATISSAEISPDNSKIAFTRFENNNHLYIINADGTGETKIEDNIYEFAFSRDGRKIIYTARAIENSQRDIYAINSDGTGKIKLTTTDVVGTFVLSPDGKKIAFGKTMSSGYQLWLMNIDGSGAIKLSDKTVAQEGSKPFVFSPDSTKVVFSGTTPGTSPDAIYVVSTDGTGEKRLTTTDIDPVTKDPTEVNFEPSFSPDGSRITFLSISIQAAKSHVAMINTDGTGRVNLTDKIFNLHQPTFSSDGKTISFFSISSLYTIGVGGGNATFVATASYGGYPFWLR
jgi:Tol biopolymer transport system component